MNCRDCIYYPKCDGCPFDESGCEVFKDNMLFVELPCKIGDTVYMPIAKWNTITGYVPDVCDGFHIGHNGVLQIKVKNDAGNHGTYGIPGRTAFLSEAEAIAAMGAV